MHQDLNDGDILLTVGNSQLSFHYNAREKIVGNEKLI